ncbi:MAG TPA: permease-like cell division protein FtsX [Salinisphaeraceae bacterium]|nr:permease-like cell division protein FtsX [Salinisphaeraceae bacterium]
MKQRLSTRLANHRHSSRLQTALEGWAAAHLRCLVEALGRMHRRWLASLLTVLVIGITLALPAGLYVMMKNLEGLTYSWKSSVQISVYLQRAVDDYSGRDLAQQIGAHEHVEAVEYISPQEGLAAFKQTSDFGDALAALPGNPLPPVIAVTPDPNLPRATISSLLEELRAYSSVEQAELDQAWLQRLHAILALLHRAAWVIGLLLAGAVIFIVGNTIRLDIENRREEIEVMKRIGASDAFIRRPFLYSGAWYGFSGALTALILLGICFLALAGPLGDLTHSYGDAFQLRGLGWAGSFKLIVIGVALGWGGCAITVSRRLQHIEPG